MDGERIWPLLHQLHLKCGLPGEPHHLLVYWDILNHLTFHGVEGQCLLQDRKNLWILRYYTLFGNVL
jgi:hypothetical protein